jgi:2-dehydro-3-deoxyphosphogluconate aldolase/(4S)-4-hydroxy-2-oxoglutarate aldolase
MHEVIARFKDLRVIPVVAIERAEDALPLADAFVEGGLPCAEITFRTPAAARAIRIMSERWDIMVGAGTVLDIEQVKMAVDAGARFMVSPGFNPRVARYCLENNIPFIPGICTPTDIEAAMDLGLEVLKFFPAEAFGGIKTLQAMSGPYTTVKFIPTGGINPQNLVEYLRFQKVVACGGTWIAPSKSISEGRFNDVLRNTREAVEIVEELRKSDLQRQRP